MNKKAKYFIFILLLAGFVTMFMVGSDGVMAAKDEGIKFKLQTSIPGSEFQRGTSITITSETLPNYIVAIYNYGVGLVAVLAVAMIMFGGFKWIFAAGNAQQIETAKTTIGSAVAGLILVLSSVLLLQTINPKLINLEMPDPEKPKITVSGCPGVVTTCKSINNLQIPNDDPDEEGSYRNKYTDVKEFRMDICQNQDKVNNESMYKRCNLPEGLCYWGDGNDVSTDKNRGACMSVIDKSCATGLGAGIFVDETKCLVNGIQYVCQSYGYKCSFGVAGSRCRLNTECTKPETLMCGSDKRCEKQKSIGEDCNENDDCEVGLVCLTCGNNRCGAPPGIGQECGADAECTFSGYDECDGNLGGLMCGVCKQ